LSALEIGSSCGKLGSFEAVVCACTAAAAFFFRVETKASAPAPAPSARNGSIGTPGRSASTIMTPEDMPSAFG